MRLRLTTRSRDFARFSCGVCVLVAAVILFAAYPSASAADSAPWLGLDYNSQTPAPAADLTEFVDHGIVYDRDSVEPAAGDTVSSQSFAKLSRSISAGMTPDIVVDPPAGNPTGCTSDPAPAAWCLPTSAADIQTYVNGFITTVQSVLQAYPNQQFLFEPMNEPFYWGSPPGTQAGYKAAAEYAAVLAKLLPAIAEASGPSIPLSDVYVPAAGWLPDGTHWIPDLYAAEPCLAPGGGPCESGAPQTPIAGWTVHPYGLPGISSQGINSVPPLRAEMRSGTDNIVVSEIGFCATSVEGGQNCSKGDWYGSGGQTARWLARTLRAAYAMHQAGWLKAMILWLRSGDGYSMQLSNGSLTAQGLVLLNFADQHVTGRVSRAAGHGKPHHTKARRRHRRSTCPKHRSCHRRRSRSR